MSTDGNSRHPRRRPRKALRRAAVGAVSPTAASKSRRRIARIASRGGRFDASCAGPAPIEETSAREVLARTVQAPRALRRLRENRRSAVQPVIEGTCRRCGEGRGHLDSLDTGSCSDMFNRPENAENTRVFGLSARWWMRPRRRRTGMQRTHLAGPSGIRTVSDQLPSRPREAAWASSHPLDRLLPSPHTEELAARDFAVSRVAESLHGPRKSHLERLPLCDNPLVRAGSGDGTSLAPRITQMVPRIGMEPLNREGARR